MQKKVGKEVERCEYLTYNRGISTSSVEQEGGTLFLKWGERKDVSSTVFA
jgi:hypothetical protein